MKRILFLGELARGQTSLMRSRAFERLGHSVRGVDTGRLWRAATWLSRLAQRSIGVGPIISELNHAVLKAAHDFHPDLIWAEKQEHLSCETIEALKKNSMLVHFTPDPYFSVTWKRTRLMDKAIRSFDALVYCKCYERREYEAAGPRAIYMPLGYCDEVHRPIPSGEGRWSCSVGFLGGWEPRREHLLHAIASRNIAVKIWGAYWEFLRDGRWNLRRHLILRQLAGNECFRIHRDPFLAAAFQGGEVYAEDYARALTGSRIGIGFLRTVCPDQHTTRTFEIPACGSMLLADRSNEHEDFFEEGKEADYFSSTDELVDKAEFYSRNEAARERIAWAGRRRCEASKYAYIHRLSAVLEALIT